MCFRGYGSQLMISFCVVKRESAPKSCVEHSCIEALELTKHLRKAYKAVEAGAVAEDRFTHPSATKTVTSDGWIIECETGLTLGKTLPFVLKCFRGGLQAWRDHCHTFESTNVRVGLWSRGRRDNMMTYPTTEDWDRHMLNYSEITKLWESVLAEVDALMADVSICAPILAEDVKIDTAG